MIRFAQLTFGILHRAIHPLALRRIRTWQGSASHFFPRRRQINCAIYFANLCKHSRLESSTEVWFELHVTQQLKISKIAQVTHALASHVGVCRGARFSFLPTKKPILLKLPRGMLLRTLGVDDKTLLHVEISDRAAKSHGKWARMPFHTPL